MVHKLNNQKNTRTLCIVFLAIGILSVLPIIISAQDTLTFSLTRNFGTGLGGSISGTFTLHGSGPDTIQNLTVYFNDVEVHFVTGNTISWQFDTANYEGGTTNITLIGITESGESLTFSQTVNFIGESPSTVITIGIIALVSVLVLIKYGPMLMSKRNK
ncbi:MAG: hypothetical protein RTU63_03010 [Candidatus Thorarchaeota archaeon]